jgi:hypothetical protein
LAAKVLAGKIEAASNYTAPTMISNCRLWPEANRSGRVSSG